MRIVLGENYCVVRREPGDPRIYSDSRLFHALRNRLIEAGHDVIKKLMCRDGCLVNADQYYVRTRAIKPRDSFAVWWGYDAIRPAYRDFNAGEVLLCVAWDLAH